MTPETKKTLGLIVGIIGTLISVSLGAWMVLVIAIGLHGSGNDEQTSAILGLGTCVCSMPVLALTLVGWRFALQKLP